MGGQRGRQERTSPGALAAASERQGVSVGDPGDQQPGYPALPAQRSAAEPEPAQPEPEPVSAEYAEPEGPTDAELLDRHVGGDPDAFGELFARHRDRLWAVAMRTLGDPEEAADALQDAMIAAFRRAESFRGDSAVTTWLHRIVVNAALDRMRRRAARPAMTGQDEPALDALATSGRPLSDPAGVSDTSMDVRSALATLVPDQQAALVLVDMLGYSVADAADVLGVSQGTVKSRAARGRARLAPRVSHLRPGAVPAQRGRNQADSASVQPEPEGGEPGEDPA